MPTYTITEDENFDETAISTNMFGTAGNVNYDYEFDANGTNGEELLDLVRSMNVSVLRFPGGSTTEQTFTDVMFETGLYEVESTTDKYLYLSEFFEFAGAVEANATLVLPTRVAFEQSAAEAMLDGTYGTREAIRGDYWDKLKDFIDEALVQAAANDVEVQTFEIGNEFWGSGIMNAFEYGTLAAKIAVWLDDNYGDQNIDIIVQETSSSNEFSRSSETTYYLELADGEYTIHESTAKLGNGDLEFPNGLPDNANGVEWFEATVPGNGGGLNQTKLIASILAAHEIPGTNETAASLIDGVVDHVYFSGGFDTIDTQRDFVLTDVFEAFKTELGRDDLEHYVTEWSPRNVNAEGLEYASSVVEGFFELASNGVHHANFWPLTFGNAGFDERVLVHTNEVDLTFGGEAFKMLSESLVGLSALFDENVGTAGIYDIHGFGNDDRLTVFASNRSDQDSNNLSFDLDDYIPNNQYFLTATMLDVSVGTAIDGDDNPDVTYSDGGRVSNTSIVDLEIAANGLTRLELTALTNGDDTVVGRNGNDTIETFRGNDTLIGGEGDDTLKGGLDQDLLLGEFGDDELWGGGGNDTFGFGGEQGFDTIRDFVVGSDILQLTEDIQTVYFEEHNDGVILSFDLEGAASVLVRNLTLSQVTTENLFGPDGQSITLRPPSDGIVTGGTGNNKIDRFYTADPDGDVITDAGQTINAGAGNDRVFDGAGDDMVNGEDGNDNFFAGDGADAYDGGEGKDNMRYSTSTSGLTIDMKDGANSSGIAQGDSFTNIERLFATIGDDTIIADDSGLTLYGLEGDDSLTDGLGRNYLYGGDGSDVFSLIVDGSKDRIVDFEDGIDKVDLTAWGVFELDQLNVVEKNGRVDIALKSNTSEILEIKGVSNMEDLTEADFIFATPPSDGIVTGTGSSDTINASYDEDPDGDVISDAGQVINAEAGNDKIYDGAGDDTVNGGLGNDKFYAGDGEDAYDGMDGNDAVYYTTSSIGLTIDMTNTSNSDGIAAGDSYSNLEKVYATNKDDTLIGDDNTARLYGLNGDDTIIDGGIYNYLYGGSGADTFVLIADGERDRIYDFEDGVDVIDISAWGLADINDLTITQKTNQIEVKSNLDTKEVLQIRSNEDLEESDLTSVDFVFA